MNAAIVIPARYASTRLPKKLLLADTGRPLICHTIDAALGVASISADAIGSVIVATDHTEIAEVVNTAGYGDTVQAMMTDLAHASGSDRVAEVMQRLPA